MKATLNIHWKDWCWSSSTLATWGEELTPWKRPWCWERLKAGGEGVTKDEIIGWHHQCNEHEFEQTSGSSERQGSLASCSPWGCKVRHNWATEQQWRERWRVLVLPLGEPWVCDVLLIRCTERCWSLLGKPMKIEPCQMASFLLLSFFLPGTQLKRWNWNHRETMWRDTNHSYAEIQKNRALTTFRLAIIYGKCLETCQVSNL